MTPSPAVAEFLDALERFAAQPLQRRDDFGLLCEAAYRGGKERHLDELAFLGKFVLRTLGIMRRIGEGGQGYDRLAAEAEAVLEKIRGHWTALAEELSPEERHRMSAQYLALTPGAFQDLLLLLQDAGWYKNWLIDHPGQPPWQPPSFS
jgi:hypothetical protein